MAGGSRRRKGLRKGSHLTDSLLISTCIMCSMTGWQHGVKNVAQGESAQSTEPLDIGRDSKNVWGTSFPWSSSYIRTPMGDLPPPIQGRNRQHESVRGVSGNRHPYRDQPPFRRPFCW